MGPADDGGDLPPEARRHSSSLRELERDLVVEAYRSTDSISEAARRLGISRSTLREKLKKYGLRGTGGSQNG
jgi:transcriptional regulator of acetoin/glycerol metabolism